MKTSMFIAGLAIIGASVMPAQADSQTGAATAAINAKASPAVGAAQETGQTANDGKFFVRGYPYAGYDGGYPYYQEYRYGGWSYGGYPYGGYPYAYRY